ncbi:MAG: aminotransferase class I/II-fold pyridoxal phosphate-dependent enzyme [Anaerolineaceae bacterium]|nr:aminotransferase class I/II-fold pyridoxal phosphate-dependent enzyme [Anaerolineaceae bacterium]
MPKIAPFKLERYFARYEFNTRYLLSSSDCESLTLPELLNYADAESRELWNTLSLGYTESAGHPLLREEIARMYTEVTADQVLEIAPEEGIFILLQTLLNAGDHVISIFPAYQSLYEIPRSLGCEVTFHPLVCAGGAWHLDLEALRGSIRSNTRLMIMNFPHNPTGFLPSDAEFEALVEIAREYGLYFLNDEMYRLLEYTEADRLPPVCDVYEKGISLSGLSKTFALPGLRVGWLAARDTALYQRWRDYKDYTTICGSAPSEILGIIALRNQRALARRSREIVLNNLETAGVFFAEFDDRFEWLPPLAGSVAFPRLLGGQPVSDWCRAVLEAKQVMIVPGEMFEMPDQHFRLGLGRRNFAEAIEQLAEFMRG